VCLEELDWDANGMNRYVQIGVCTQLVSGSLSLELGRLYFTEQLGGEGQVQMYDCHRVGVMGVAGHCLQSGTGAAQNGACGLMGGLQWPAVAVEQWNSNRSWSWLCEVTPVKWVRNQDGCNVHDMLAVLRGWCFA